MKFQMGEAGPHGWGRAGEGETSVLLALHPALFQEDRWCKDGHPLQPGRAARGKRYRWLHESAARGNYGDPALGTAARGERLLSAVAALLRRAVEDNEKGHLLGF